MSGRWPAAVWGASGRSTAGAATDPAGALLRGATVPAVVVGALVTAVCAALGGRAAAGAAVGAVLAVLACAVGPLVLRTAAQWSPPAVMAAAVGGYLIVVLLLGVVYLLLAPVSWLAQQQVGIALLLSTAAGLAGQVRAVLRMRVLAFGSGRTGEPPSEPAVGPGE